MANNSKGRPATQRPSVFRPIAYGSKERKPPRGRYKGLEGVDRTRIDLLAEDERDSVLTREVWDE